MLRPSVAVGTRRCVRVRGGSGACRYRDISLATSAHETRRPRERDARVMFFVGPQLHDVVFAATSIVTIRSCSLIVHTAKWRVRHPQGEAPPSHSRNPYDPRRCAMARFMLPRPRMPRSLDLIAKARQLGFDQLGDDDVLAIVLASGRDTQECKAIAAVLLDDFGGLNGVWRLARDGLSGLSPLGPARWARLAAAFELGLRCLERKLPERGCIRCSADIAMALGPRLRTIPIEQVWVLGLDSRNALLARRRVAEGGQHGCAIQAPDVLRIVLSVGASAFVLVHNHPGGEPRPSRQDLHLTQKLSAAAACIGVPMLDHVIIAGAEHFSLLDAGLMGREPLFGESMGAGRVAQAATTGRHHTQSG